MGSHITPFLASVSNKWMAAASALPAQTFRSQLRVDAEIGKLVIEIETPNHVALVEAWEHASCLDVTIVDARSLASTSLAAGPCSNEAQVNERLAALCATLQAS
jgi:hypothetical protein